MHVYTNHLYKGHNVEDQSWWLASDELVAAGNGMGPDDWVLMMEVLNEFWNENIEGSIESIRIKLVRAIFTDLQECTKRPLHTHTHNHTVTTIVTTTYFTGECVRRVDELTESW